MSEAGTAQVKQYFEALRATYDTLSQAVKDASERGTTISGQLIEEIERGQREALTLGEQLATEPTNVAENYTAVLEATLSAQDRALQLAKDTYSQTEAAGTNATKLFEQLFDTSRTMGEATMELSRAWVGDSAWSDAWRQGVESMTAAASGTSKTAAS